ncbi:protein of unknown function (plasmid) [Cupriavidus taiwanensis]|uniref:Uncharacterized protein n=1 Tax=Cupriavidus taiwanensis TaxID=164546 RepID=A0A375EDK9_9BURK|nr:protein of unknown function [Cupriavidus taiwanensis]SOZ72484.1 protein of unknown function [Cupriavidus taiwanensis]SOZ74917.1 protein of unknown function [Cupriavidus taiwanensis]SPA03347.1 protein of unknown function [Cupriavidus taiwanensis]SPA11713.1 protein of unknown function [Cupriavidus taiwanensis]
MCRDSLMPTQYFGLALSSPSQSPRRRKLISNADNCDDVNIDSLGQTQRVKLPGTLGVQPVDTSDEISSLAKCHHGWQCGSCNGGFAD